MNYINKCIALAIKGSKKVSPNPMVGAILVHNDVIIGRGYHKKFGGHHAEVEAINNSIKIGNEKLIKNSTLFVTLEPCSHQGKTPPCVELIKKMQIKKVVIGALDPNPIVNGRGVLELKKNNIETVILNDQGCVALLEIFKKNLLKMPFVHLKIALTKDFSLTTVAGKRTKLTSEKSDRFVHKLRSKYDAILTGGSTIEIDNPMLTARNGKKVKFLTKIIIDSKNGISENYNVFNQEGRIIVLTLSDRKFKNQNIEVIKCKSENGKIDLENALKKLFDIGIYSVLVEGGYKLTNSLLDSKLIDKLTVILTGLEARNAEKLRLPQPILKQILEHQINKKRSDSIITLNLT